jgi:hypothetical protein
VVANSRWGHIDMMANTFPGIRSMFAELATMAIGTDGHHTAKNDSLNI